MEYDDTEAYCNCNWMFEIQKCSHIYRQRLMRQWSTNIKCIYFALPPVLEVLFIWNKHTATEVVIFQMCSSLKHHLSTVIQWHGFCIPSANFAWPPCCIYVSYWIKYGFRISLVCTWKGRHMHT
jgi:hypothetical protein